MRFPDFDETVLTLLRVVGSLVLVTVSLSSCGLSVKNVGTHIKIEMLNTVF